MSGSRYLPQTSSKSLDPRQDPRSAAVPAVKAKAKTPKAACWGCKKLIPATKSLCDTCFNKAAQEREAPAADLETLVRKVVRDSLQHKDPPPVDISPTGSPRSPDLAFPDAEQWSSPQGDQAAASLASDSEDEEQETGFKFSLVPVLVKAIKETLDLEDPAVPPPKQKKLFRQLNRERQFFPLVQELAEITKGEWAKADKRGSLAAKVHKLYPFREEDVRHLETAPSVDAALMRLARYVTLPLEDTVSFKDPLERKIDTDLRRIYLTAGMACKPALALAVTSKAMESWAEKVEETLAGFSAEAARESPIYELRLAAGFLEEASLDLIRLVSRVMLSSVTAKRALWLRPWRADPASKQAWCRIPFEGSSLFGDKLNEAISRATGGKSGFLPQDRQPPRNRPTFRRRSAERAKEARSYRPGREFNRPWKTRRGQESKPQKGESSGGAKASKSF